MPHDIEELKRQASPIVQRLVVARKKAEEKLANHPNWKEYGLEEQVSVCRKALAAVNQVIKLVENPQSKEPNGDLTQKGLKTTMTEVSALLERIKGQNIRVTNNEMKGTEVQAVVKEVWQFVQKNQPQQPKAKSTSTSQLLEQLAALMPPDSLGVSLSVPSGDGSALIRTAAAAPPVVYPPPPVIPVAEEVISSELPHTASGIPIATPVGIPVEGWSVQAVSGRLISPDEIARPIPTAPDSPELEEKPGDGNPPPSLVSEDSADDKEEGAQQEPGVDSDHDDEGSLSSGSGYRSR